MKQATFFAVCIAAFHFSFARPSYNKIDFSTETYKDSSAVNIIPSAQVMLQEIINVTGLQLNFELKEADVLNMEASVSHHKRYILYNPSFIARINSLTKDKWAAMALFAHEIGHHLNGHTTSKNRSSPELELQADEFAGFIMRKLGATLVQSQNVMNLIAKTEESSTHPSKKSRMLAIEKGWNKATSLETAISAKP